MLAVIGLEYIGENYYSYERNSLFYHAKSERYKHYLRYDFSRPWVAKITGRHPVYRYNREFMRGRKDYSRSNSVGSRGIYLYFYLEDGIYEVNERVSWTTTKRYFVRAECGEYEEIEKEEVEECLNSILI